jgi:flagellar biosynthesis chaperone FliJ
VSARRDRLAKLLAIEESRVNAAESAVAEARARLAAAEGILAHAASEAQASLDRWHDVTSTSELEHATQRRSWLRAAMSRAQTAVTNAAGFVAEREAQLVAARISARKVELLVESIERVEIARAAVAERRRDDDHAARWRATR